MSHCYLLIFYVLDSPTVIFDTTAAGFGVATGPITIDEVRCIGDERSLISCPNAGIGTHNCIHSQDVGLRCATRKVLCCNSNLVIPLNLAITQTHSL